MDTIETMKKNFDLKIINNREESVKVRR